MLSCNEPTSNPGFFDTWWLLDSDDALLTAYSRDYCFLFKSDSCEVYQQDIDFHREPTVYLYNKKAPDKLAIEDFGTIVISDALETEQTDDWLIEVASPFISASAIAVPCYIFD